MKNDGIIILSENRKAFHDYLILDSFETGIVLTGSEVKSARAKHVNLSGSYVSVLKDELWLIKSHISEYGSVGFCSHDCTRDRKLLCHKKQIRDLKMKTEAKSLTAVPLKMYLKNGKIKLEIGVAKGKNTSDKRISLKEKALRRDYEMNI